MNECQLLQKTIIIDQRKQTNRGTTIATISLLQFLGYSLQHHLENEVNQQESPF